MNTKLLNLLMFASKQAIYLLVLNAFMMQLVFASASSSQSMEKITISIQVENAQLQEIFQVIRNQTGFVFSYSDNILQNNERYSFNYTKVAVADLLREIAKEDRLRFLRVNQNISVIREKKKIPDSQLVMELDRTISGKVTDAETGEPIAGVNVVVSGSSIGTITDVAGEYTIEVPETAEKLTFSYVGYEALEIQIGNRSVIDVSLTVDLTSLNEVVVTALGIEKDIRTIGSAVQEVIGKDLAETRETNLINNLSGRIAGLDIQRSSAGLAGSVRAVIRGESSLNINKNQPLFVVNGVPINNQITPSGSSNYGGSDLTVDYGNGAAEINPDDIESINVLKGPAAAALYGSRAANGVIMITTKTGKGVNGIGVSVNSNTTFDSILRLPDYQNAHGAGGVAQNNYYSYGPSSDGPSTANTGHSWGPKFEGQNFVQYGSPVDENGDRVPIPWRAYPNNVSDFFETGRTLNNNVSIQGSNDMGNFRLSYTNLDQTGIFPNTELKRNSISLSAAYSLTNKLKINSNINYVKSQSDNLPNSGYGASAPMYAFIWFERNADIEWLRDYWVEGREGIQQNYFHTWADNPYFVAYEHINAFNKDRIYGNISLTYNFNDELSLMLRSGTDFSNENRTFRRPYSTVGLPRGRYRAQDVYFNEVNSDFLLSYNKSLSSDWDVSISLGGNAMTQDFRDNVNDARELTIPGVYNMGNAAGMPIISEFNSTKTINSLYGMSEISFKQYLFLTLTGRNDWSSALPLDKNSYFYPSVGLSAIFTDMFNLNSSLLSFAKLRLSWAQVGNDTDPYRLNNTFNYYALPQSVTVPGVIPNSELRPEIASSYEIGTDIRLFNSRLGIDFTYYNMESRNQIIDVQTPITSGYTSKILNAGKITNRGIEIIVNTTPIKTNSFSWDILINYSRNRSEIVELTEGIDNYIVASTGMGTVEARVGGRMGDIYGQKLKRTPDGEIIHKNGIPQVSPTIENLGNYNPDWMGGIYNNFRYKNFYLGVLFDTKQGGEIVSLTHAAGSEAGILPHTLPGRENGIIGEGVEDNGDGTFSPNTTSVPAPNYYRARYHRTVTESHTFDASFIKLREVKIGYDLPSKLISATPFRSATISIVGRNLALWTDVPHIDPETTTVRGATVIPGFEFTQLPSTRSIGFNINLSF